MGSCFDEMYEIMDEMNARIEEIVNEHNDPETLELVIQTLHQMATDFVNDFEEEVEKLDLIEAE